jgi:hypothetical protein
MRLRHSTDAPRIRISEFGVYAHNVVAGFNPRYLNNPYC